MIVVSRYPQQQFIKSRNIFFTTTSTENHIFKFSTCSYLRAARSPRVKNLEWQRQQKTRQPLQQTISTPIQWPMIHLQAAEKSGEIPVSLRAAIAILDDFEDSRVMSGKELCSKHGVEPSVLTSLACALLRTGNVKYYPTVQALLVAASELNDSSATLIIAENSIRSKKLTMPSVSRQHLDRMVSEKHPVATFLLGKIYQNQGRTSDALKMFEESITIPSKNYSGAEAAKINISDAWRGIFRIKIKDDKQGAEFALKKSALDLDDPKSYLLLAKGFTPKSSKEYETYLLKAAASGEMRAVDALGIYYFKQSQGCMSLSSKKASIRGTRGSIGRSAIDILVTKELGGVSPETVSRKRKLAEDWFKIGAEFNIESSQVHLAILLREAGKLSEGMDWLEKASISNAWTKTVAWFQEMWKSRQIDFMLIDVEKLHKREDGINIQAVGFD